MTSLWFDYNVQRREILMDAQNILCIHITIYKAGRHVDFRFESQAFPVHMLMHAY